MDTQQGNELTLEALAQRLEALERENERVSSENAELRHEVSALRASGTRRGEVAEMRGSETRRSGQPMSVLEGQVSRRSLLSKAGAAAVAAMAAGTLMYPRRAHASHFDNGINVDFINTHQIRSFISGEDVPAFIGETTSGTWGALDVKNNAGGPGVRGKSDEGTGVEGISNDFTGDGVAGKANGGLGTGVSGTGGFIGVDGIGNVGVRGTGTDAQQAGVKGEGPTGVWGITTTTDFAGVYGEHKGTAGHGTVGIGKGGHAGVLGRNLNTNGIGVQGVTNNTDGLAGVKGEGSTGVWGVSSKTSFSGVYGEHTGTSGHGTVGIGKGGAAGVLGRNPGGAGVLGEGRNGVHGKANGGYGGLFEGGKAQLMLKPAASAGKPTTGTHTKGEIYMDKAGALFVCTAGDGTTVGTWKKVNMKLV